MAWLSINSGYAPVQHNSRILSHRINLEQEATYALRQLHTINITTLPHVKSVEAATGNQNHRNCLSLSLSQYKDLVTALVNQMVKFRAKTYPGLTIFAFGIPVEGQLTRWLG